MVEYPAVNRWTLRQIDIPTRLASVSLWLVVGACCGTPMIWLLSRLIFDWRALAPALLDERSLEALLRTIILNAIATIVAIGFAIAPAMWVGSATSRGVWLAITLVALPLLLPSIVVTYAWTNAIDAIGLLPRAGSRMDEIRCALTLAAWIWPVPALSMGLALRRIDQSLLWQARLDGAHRTVIARMILPAMAIGAIGAFVLANQEFAVYEPSGVLVVGVLVRQMFVLDLEQSTQVLSAVATLLPLILLTLGMSLAALLAARRESRWVDLSNDRISLRLPIIARMIAWIITALATLGPVVVLVLIHRGAFDAPQILDSIGPNILASAEYALTSAGVALLISIAACIARARTLLWIAAIVFLIGGQLIAIVLIRVLNDPNFPALIYLYDSPLVATISNLSRFSWIALAAGLVTWQPAWRTLRDMSSAEGASLSQTARFVIIPLARPILLAATLIIAALSFTEVAATVLLQPSGSIVAPLYHLLDRQPSGSIIPMMMTWVHTLRWDPLIEASLVVVAIVLLLGLLASLIGRRMKWE